MANTWHATTANVSGNGILYAPQKSMIDLFNSSASTRVIRVYRIYHFNNQTVAVNGTLTSLQIRRTSNSSGMGDGAIYAIPHDSAYSNLNDNTTIATNRVTTNFNIFRRYLYSVDEPSTGGTTADEFQCTVPFAEIWNAGYGDSNIAPVFCRPGYGLEVYHPGNVSVGVADFEMEFTDSAS